MDHDGVELHRIDCLSGGSVQPIELQVRRSPSTARTTLALEVDRSQVSVEGVDTWTALLDLREKLDQRGIRLGIAGALPEVWPSGMSHQMSGGRKAYQRVADGSPILVDVLDPVDPRLVVSVADQQSALEDWVARQRSAYEAWQASHDIRRR